MSRLRLISLTLSAALLALTARAHALTCPNIMFVVDRSSSMAEDVNGMMSMPPSKFDLARDAVIQIVNTYGDRVSMGLQMFRSDAFRNDAKCYSDTMIDVSPGHETATDI